MSTRRGVKTRNDRGMNVRAVSWRLTVIDHDHGSYAPRERGGRYFAWAGASHSLGTTPGHYCFGES